MSILLSRTPRLSVRPSLPPAVDCGAAVEARRPFLRAFSESPHQDHSVRLTFPLFSYCHALFCTGKNPIPPMFKSFHTLSVKHPGVGVPRFLAAR